MLVQKSLFLFCLTVIAITDGKEAPSGKYDQHVSIRFKGAHICSGSIINKRHILTAYSCVISTSAKDLTVVAGTNSLSSGGDSYKIQEIIARGNSYDDIAILRTRNEITFRRGVQKLGIDNHNKYAINSPLTVVGWESPPPGERRRSGLLQEFPHRLYDPDLCRIKNNFYGRKSLCIVDPSGQGVCNMDHGGGIIASGYLIGIYLNTESCGNGREPTAHTPLYEYIDWIKSNSNEQQVINPGASGTGESCSGNHDAPYGTHRYHVSVRRSNEHICSGSIINKRFVLTSQICVIRDSPQNLYVIAGTNSLTNPGILYGVEKIISHPDEDDFISLLQINRDIKFDYLTQPIPMANYDYGSVGQSVTFTAFRKPVSGQSTNNVLQAFSWKIYDLKKCAKEYDDYFDQRHICTVNSRYENMCNIDYGGAVVANGVQIGMKFLPDGYTPNVPIVHHRIHYYSAWIKKNSDITKIAPTDPNRPPRNGKLDHDAPDGAYPYHVSITRHNQHICSGSIINKRHILTSNNCILRDGSKDLFVVAGTNSLTKAGELYQVQNIIPTYDYKYDIAILRTTKNIIFNNDVQPISIANSNINLRDSDRLILTGWERQIGSQYRNDKLQQVSYQPYARKLCEQMFISLNEAYMCSINPSHEKACNMDYGGPIVRNGVQIGLNLFGVRCESNNEPHMYLPLYKHSTWIQRNSRI